MGILKACLTLRGTAKYAPATGWDRKGQPPRVPGKLGCGEQACTGRPLPADFRHALAPSRPRAREAGAATPQDRMAAQELETGLDFEVWFLLGK